MFLRRGCLSIVGSALVLIGIPMLVCPGPGMLAITAGLALIFTGRLSRTPHDPHA